MAENDHDLRQRVLRRLYELRHVKQFVRSPHDLVDLGLEERMLGNILRQLKERGRIDWNPFINGPANGLARITVEGVEVIEDPRILTQHMPDAPMQAHPIHTLVGWATVVMGLALVAFGIVALWRGSVSDTEFTILGNVFKSGSVGAVAVFLGVILLILNYRRLLLSVERLTKS